MEKRPNRMYAVVEVVIASLIWLMNLIRLPTHLQYAGFMEKASSVMILVFAPALVWQAIQRAR